LIDANEQLLHRDEELARLGKENAVRDAELDRVRIAMGRQREELERTCSRLASQEGELENVRTLQQTVDDQAGHLELLRRQLDLMSERRRELRRLFLSAHEQLVSRDEQFISQDEIQAFYEEIQWLRGLLEVKDNEVADLRGEVSLMKQTRVWRLGFRYWRLREGLKRMLHIRPRRSLQATRQPRDPEHE
jgi:hypothetical protein